MSFPKFQYIRSKPLLKAVASLECQHCGKYGLTQAAHSNQAAHGKGRGIKSSDVFTAALCATCHYELDQGKRLEKYERDAMWSDAWRKTVTQLVKRGLWPMAIDIPDIRALRNNVCKSV